jgi:hypothetical protein
LKKGLRYFMLLIDDQQLRRNVEKKKKRRSLGDLQAIIVLHDYIDICISTDEKKTRSFDEREK